MEKIDLSRIIYKTTFKFLQCTAVNLMDFPFHSFYSLLVKILDKSAPIPHFEFAFDSYVDKNIFVNENAPRTLID